MRDLHERAHAHGVRTALGWLRGELPRDAAAPMAPIHHEDGRLVDAEDRASYAQRLCELAADSTTPTVREPASAG